MKLLYEQLNGADGHKAGLALLEKLWGSPLPEIRRTKLGKPYFANSPLHFSISHTKQYVFAAVSETPIGIDAEELDRKVHGKLAEKILSPSEKEQYDAAENKIKALLTFWVLKEAQAKLTGEGLRIYPNHTNFTLDDPRVTETEGCLVAVMEE